MRDLRVPCNLADGTSLSQAAEKVLEALGKNGVWIAPTETIYGLSGTGLDPQIDRRIREIKGRDFQKPFVYLVRDVAALKRHMESGDAVSNELAELLEGGGITLVVKGNGLLPGKKVALRVAGDPLHKLVLAARDVPLISTSANRSGEAYLDSPEIIFGKLGAEVDLMIDAGPLGNATPSTVMDITGRPFTIIREGARLTEVKGFAA